MVTNNRVKPLLNQSNHSNAVFSISSQLSEPRSHKESRLTGKEVNDLDSLSTVGLEESSYLKLRPFTRLDPTLVRLSRFLGCFGVTINTVSSKKTNEKEGWKKNWEIYSKWIKIAMMMSICIISSEVVYDVNLRQSKLLAEQKRSTPLLTFVIVAYSWLTLIIPIICDLSLVLIGSHLFRFYSRTTATVCGGVFFGRKTSVDSWYYYLTVVIITFLDAAGQVVVLGVWPKSIDPYMRMMINTDRDTAPINLSHTRNSTDVEIELDAELNGFEQPDLTPSGPKIRADLLDFFLGETHAHGDLGICIKILCLMIQLIHTYAFLMIIILLANHYATVINDINENLDKYEFRRLFKQLIVLRDSSEQISLIISIPLAFIIILAFMRQIALNGVFIQSTMLPFENWVISLQSFTCNVSISMVFIYCDGLQGASKQTHRLKTEQTVINDNRGGNQSIYEFLDYLNRLSKSIRITFFNIISINKSSLVGLYGHILTLTFVTS